MKINRLLSAFEMRKHALDLSRAWNVVLHCDPMFRWLDARAGFFEKSKVPAAYLVKHPHVLTLPADHKLGIAMVPEIRTPTDYAVALHELGHLCHPLGDAKECSTLLSEISAWEWAEHYALTWSPDMEYLKNLCLDTYRRKK